MTKTIFITGCSSGIGKQTAQVFLNEGWNVVATMRNPEEAALKGNNLLVLPLDVTDTQSVKEAVSAAHKKFGNIDVLVNNAGFGLFGPFEYETDEDIRRQFDTNVLGLMSVTREVLPLLKANGAGIIINVSSVLGQVGVPFYSAYSASKWAVEGFSETLAYELAQFNIQVKLIEPGPVKTDFYQAKGFVAKRDVGEYQNYFEQVLAYMKKAEASGSSAEEVSRIILKAAQSSAGTMRYPVGASAKTLLFLRKVTPIDLFRKILKASVK